MLHAREGWLIERGFSEKVPPEVARPQKVGDCNIDQRVPWRGEGTRMVHWHLRSLPISVLNCADQAV